MRCSCTALRRTSIRSAIFAVLRRFLLVCFLAAAIPWNTTANAKPSAIDVSVSKMTVYVYKRGMFSFLADNHEIEAPIAGGSYDAAARAVEVHVKAAALKVLDPSLAPDRRAKVQAAMVGPQVLDVDKYPDIEFQSTAIAESGRNLKITGDLSLHGQTHPIVISAQEVDATHYTGSATIRQTEFGITPIKVAGGAVSVQDDVKVEFQVALQ